jgi:hypothetical protein
VIHQGRLPEQQTSAASGILQARDIPQNQRLLRDLLAKSEPRKPLSFAAGDANYGQNLAVIKERDEEFWLGHSDRLIMNAESSSSAAKRMFLELRDIRTSKIPFISAAPLGDSLDKVLAHFLDHCSATSRSPKPTFAKVSDQGLPSKYLTARAHLCGLSTEMEPH